MPTDVALLLPDLWLLAAAVIGASALVLGLGWLWWRQQVRWGFVSTYDREQRALAAFRNHLGRD